MLTGAEEAIWVSLFAFSPFFINLWVLLSVTWAPLLQLAYLNGIMNDKRRSVGKCNWWLLRWTCLMSNRQRKRPMSNALLLSSTNGRPKPGLWKAPIPQCCARWIRDFQETGRPKCSCTLYRAVIPLISSSQTEKHDLAEWMGLA